jgi:hypothetical protein
MTELDKPLKRQIRIDAVAKPINVTIHKGGMEMAVAGSRMKIYAPWEDVIKVMTTPLNVPSPLHQRPMLLLQREAK